jgi:hypothetical protein
MSGFFYRVDNISLSIQTPLPPTSRPENRIDPANDLTDTMSMTDEPQGIIHEDSISSQDPNLQPQPKHKSRRPASEDSSPRDEFQREICE